MSIDDPLVIAGNPSPLHNIEASKIIRSREAYNLVGISAGGGVGKFKL